MTTIDTTVDFKQDPFAKWLEERVRETEKEIRLAQPLCGPNNTCMPYLRTSLEVYKQVKEQYEYMLLTTR